MDNKEVKQKLLTRDEFRERVFNRDNYKCVVPNCKNKAKDAHHIIERKLWKDGGYYLDNGASLCEIHHVLAERNKIVPRTIREYCKIYNITVSDSLNSKKEYTKWDDLSKNEQQDFMIQNKLVDEITAKENWQGIEIYEENIIEDKVGNIAKVGYFNGEFTLLISSEGLLKGCNRKKKDSFFRNYKEMSKWYDCKIIGNKYKNPELLK